MLVVFHAHVVRALPSRKPCVSTELRPIMSKYKGHILKFVPTLELVQCCRPFRALDEVDGAPMPLERTLGVVGLLSGCRPLRFHRVSTTRALQSCIRTQLFCLPTMARQSVWARGAEFLASPRAPACPELVAMGRARSGRGCGGGARGARWRRQGAQSCPCGHRRWPKIRCRGLDVA